MLLREHLHEPAERPERSGSPLPHAVTAWLQAAVARNRTLEKPDRRDAAVVAGMLLAAPFAIVFTTVWFFFGSEFAKARKWERVLLVPLTPVLMPYVYFHVVCNDLIRPLLRRMQVRRRILRAADREVKRLMREVGM